MRLILEIQRIVKECYEKARRVLTENRDKLDIIAKTLLEVETLDAEQIKHLVDHGTLPERKIASTTIDASTKDVKVNIMKKDEDPIEGTNPIAEKHSSNDEIANTPKDNSDNRL